MKRLVIFGFIIILIISLPIFINRSFAYSTQWKQVPNSPTPTPSCSPTPTIAPTPISSPSAVPLPVVIPNNNSGSSSNNNSGGSSSGGGSSNNAPAVAFCGISFNAPLIQGWSFGKNHGSLTFAWWPSTYGNVTSQSIQYGYSQNALVYGVPNLPNNIGSYTINDLAVGKHVYAQVTAYSQGCGENSNIFDPIVK